MDSINIEKSMIKKFIDIKTLKEIKLSLYSINNDEINSIEGENTSVKKLIIDFENNYDYDNGDEIYNLLKKFPNLTKIEIYDKYSQIKKINLEQNSKIERLKYSRGFYNRLSQYELSIVSFEHLKDLELRNITKIKIPIFNEHFDNNFKSLIKFQLDNSNYPEEKIDLKVINYIIKNINEIPSLKCFIFKCYSNINEKEYFDLIKKILKLKIKSIEFGINSFVKYRKKIYCNKEYTKHELETIYEDIDFKNFENIKIYKFNVSRITSDIFFNY